MNIQKINTDIKNAFQAKILKIVTFAVLGLILLLFVFKAGMVVGFKQARFSYGFSENYERNFGGHKPFGDFNGNFIRANGVAGQIIKIEEQAIAVKDGDGIEKIILITNKTEIRKIRDIIKPEDLKLDDFIVIIGEPDNNGRIEAKLIRLMPQQISRNSKPFMMKSFIK